MFFVPYLHNLACFEHAKSTSGMPGGSALCPHTHLTSASTQQDPTAPSRTAKELGMGTKAGGRHQDTKLTWDDTTVTFPRLHPSTAGRNENPAIPTRNRNQTEGECEAAIKYHHVQSAVSYGHVAEQLSPVTSQSCSFREPKDCS